MTHELRRLQEGYDRLRRNNSIAALKVESNRLKDLMSAPDYEKNYGDLRSYHEMRLKEIPGIVSQLEELNQRTLDDTI